MADPHEPGPDDAVVGDDVRWEVDADGTEYFLDEDGVRWELGDDGYAYALEPPETPETPETDETAQEAPAAAEPPSPAPAGTEDTDVIPAATVREPTPTPTATWPSHEGTEALLQLAGVRSGYGKLPVLHGVEFGIRRGETAVLFGLNGAGKTTTAMSVCGALDTWGGRIDFDGHDATRWGTRQSIAKGIVLVPEGRRVFPELSVERNLQVGAWTQRSRRWRGPGSSSDRGSLHGPGQQGWFEHQRDRVFEYFPRLRERRVQLAGTLSGGEQQMLAIGRGLMANPRLLIIDEASMGLAPVIVQDVFDIVSQINTDGVTVMMIEQNVGALDVADVALVMEQGRIIRELRGDELADRSLVSEVLMG